MSRILIAGGAGFLGSHVIDALLGRGDEVVCIDDFSTGRRENIAHHGKNDRFTLLEGDISHALPNVGDLDGVMHLASPASPPQYLQRPKETMLAGSEGTRRLLELAHSSGARFLLASTSEVYGDPDVHPQKESYRGNVDPTGPRSVYDEAKRFSEALTMLWQRYDDTNVAIARIFNTYGPRLTPGDGRVVSNFIVQALQGVPLTIYGDGTQTRSLCFADDEVDGLLRLFDSGEHGPMNLGNPDERTIEEIAKKVIALCTSSSELTYGPLPKDDPTRRRPDISYATEALGWKPATSLDNGLGKTIEYFSAQLALKPKGS